MGIPKDKNKMKTLQEIMNKKDDSFSNREQKIFKMGLRKFELGVIKNSLSAYIDGDDNGYGYDVTIKKISNNKGVRYELKGTEIDLNNDGEEEALFKTKLSKLFDKEDLDQLSSLVKYAANEVKKQRGSLSR